MHFDRLSKFISELTEGRVARGAVLSLMIRIGAMGLGFAQAVLIARLLGPAGYGIFAVTLSAASLAASLGLLGLGGYAVREVSRLVARAEFGAVKGFVLAAVLVVFVAAATSGAVVAGMTALSRFDLPVELHWSLALTPLMAMVLLLRGVSQGFGRVFDAQAPTELVRPTAMVLVLGIALVFAVPINPSQTLMLLAVANVLALMLAVFVVGRVLANLARGKVKVYQAREWVRGAMPFLGTVVLATILLEMNTLMLVWLSGPKETGLFQPVLRMSMLMLIGAQAVIVPLSPRISELWEHGETERLRGVVRTATITFALTTIGICIVILLLAPWLLAAFGKAFTAGVPALALLAAAKIFSAACGPVAQLLDMTNHQRLSMFCLIPSILANFVVGYWLIPELGAYGAAIAMASNIVIWNVLMVIMVRRKLGFDPSLVGIAWERLKSE